MNDKNFAIIHSSRRVRKFCCSTNSWFFSWRGRLEKASRSNVCCQLNICFDNPEAAQHASLLYESQMMTLKVWMIGSVTESPNHPHYETLQYFLLATPSCLLLVHLFSSSFLFSMSVNCDVNRRGKCSPVSKRERKSLEENSEKTFLGDVWCAITIICNWSTFENWNISRENICIFRVRKILY